MGSALSSREAPDALGSALEWRNEVDFELDLEADRGQLFRVLNNLGRNARQAGAGIVCVGARREGGSILINVADDGPGLSDKARDKLFEPFSGSVRDGGTGLGLVIARDIMRAHGGDIELVKTGASGTTFRLILPARNPKLIEKYPILIKTMTYVVWPFPAASRILDGHKQEKKQNYEFAPHQNRFCFLVSGPAGFSRKPAGP